ncbi:pseudouridylate synthase, partial [Xanthomonas vasicola pv. musacearum NCPPB 4380]
MTGKRPCAASAVVHAVACRCGALAGTGHGADNPPVSISSKHLQILYQDDVLAVVDKPAGLMAHDSKLARGEDDFL